MIFSQFIPPSWKEHLRRRAGAVTLEARLSNLAKAGFNPKKIIDAGAYQGDWSAIVSRVFNQSEILMIEPLPHMEKPLRKFCQEHAQCTHFKTLLGNEPGVVRFLSEETNSRIVDRCHQSSIGEKIVELPVARLEDVCAESGFNECDYLKLDLQGHELKALEGAGEMFGRVEVIQIEVSWLRIGPVPLVHEVIEHFKEKGYQMYDILGFNYRPRDHALWQSDLIFVRKDSKLISSTSWA